MSKPAYLIPPVFTTRLVRERQGVIQRESVDGMQDAYSILRTHLEDQDKEHFVVLVLDSKHQVIGLVPVHVGTAWWSPVCPRDVIKPVLLLNGMAIIVAHNHPSGDPSPSPEDIEVTLKLKEACKMFDIELLDHIVIGHGRYESLQRKGLLS